MKINFKEILDSKASYNKWIQELTSSEIDCIIDVMKEVWNLAVTECAEEVKMTGIAYGSDTSISDYEVDKQSILKLKI